VANVAEPEFTTLCVHSENIVKPRAAMKPRDEAQRNQELHEKLDRCGDDRAETRRKHEVNAASAKIVSRRLAVAMIAGLRVSARRTGNMGTSPGRRGAASPIARKDCTDSFANAGMITAISPQVDLESEMNARRLNGSHTTAFRHAA